MSSQSLYRKWRSQTFADIVGQEHITRTLLNALRAGRVAHAYLFCGPRGTGKTSTARLLAKALNCLNNEGAGEPCNECAMCRAITEGRAMDIVEIDAASNRGIDDIRELREKANFAPGEARRKFYIVDEVHQLTPEAFNALLKTIEEPPAHARFVLASTEVHKIPATILSRCQRFDFRRIAVREMVARLRLICEGEGIAADEAALVLVARAATGSMRDAVSALDQLRSFCEGTIDVAAVEALLGSRGGLAVRELAGFVFAKDLGGGLRLLNSLADEGVEMRQLGREIVDYLRQLLLVKAGATPPEGLNLAADAEATLREQANATPLPEIVRALNLFARADFSARTLVQPQLPLEMALAEAVLGETAPAAAASSTPPPRHSFRELLEPPRPAAGEPTPRPAPAAAPTPLRPTALPPRPTPPARPAAATQPPAATPPAPRPAPAAAAAEETLPVAQLREAWGQVVETVGRSDKKVQALLRDCLGPERAEGKTVVLGFQHDFHRGAVEQDKNRIIVESALSAVLGHACLVRCVVGTRQEQAQPAAAIDDPLVRAALAQGARIKNVKNVTTGEAQDDQ
ncbi:MAG: DNA polymerase III subunit gamma/tau [Chloroflexota bacterium]